jgi:hypothetical protein
LDKAARRLRPYFWALAALLALDVARVAFIEPHWDEDALLAVGWLLARGWKLYSGVFSHHLPLDYLPAWLLAAAGLPMVEGARWLMIAAWLGTCLLAFEAWSRRHSERLAPFLFLLLSSQWLTYWHGQMLLVENLWALAAVSAALLLGGPFGIAKSEPDSKFAICFGGLIGFMVSASLVAWPPALLLLVWAAKDPAWRGRARFAAAGAAAFLLPFWLWAFLHADLSQLWAQAVRFNTQVYARFHPYGGSGAALGYWATALGDNARYFSTALRWNSLERYFEGLLKLACLVWVGRLLASRGRRLEGLWWAVFLLCLRSRPERQDGAVPFHASPFFLAATAVASAGLSALWRAWGATRARRAALAMAAAVVLAPTVLATSQATASLGAFAGRSSAEEVLTLASRRCLEPGEAVFVGPMYPRLYLEMEREPAAPAVFYLPWQAAWEPQRAAHVASLATQKAGLVVIQDTAVWGKPWKEYASDVEAELKRGYTLVSAAASKEPGEAPSFSVYVPKARAEAFVRCAAPIAEMLRPVGLKAP